MFVLLCNQNDLPITIHFLKQLKHQLIQASLFQNKLSSHIRQKNSLSFNNKQLKQQAVACLKKANIFKLEKFNIIFRSPLKSSYTEAVFEQFDTY